MSSLFFSPLFDICSGDAVRGEKTSKMPPARALQSVESWGGSIMSKNNKKAITPHTKTGVLKKVKDTTAVSCSLISTFERMASDEFKDITARLRAGDKDLKKELPALIVSADTITRKACDADTRTGLIFADLDGKDHPKLSFDELKNKSDLFIQKTPWAIGYFVSPSGDGIKILCGIDPSGETHKRSFDAMKTALEDAGLVTDKSCKDLKRLTFLCHDENIVETLINPFKKWERVNVPLPAEVAELKNSRAKSRKEKTPKSSKGASKEIADLLAQLSPNMDYSLWVECGMIAHSHGADLSVWDGWSKGGESYKEGECAKKWKGFSVSGGKTIASLRAMVAEGADVEAFKRQFTQSCWRNNKSNYFLTSKNGSRIDQMNLIDISRHIDCNLEDLGINDPRPIRKRLLFDHQTNKVPIKNVLGDVAGTPVGVIDGQSILVTSTKPQLEAIEGDCDTIKRLMVTLFREETPYVLAWMQRFMSTLYTSEDIKKFHRIMVFVGEAGCGKTFFTEVILSSLFGSHAPCDAWLNGKGNQFTTSGFVAHELLVCDDGITDARHASRQRVATTLKNFAVTSRFEVEGKGKNSFLLPDKKMVVLINMNKDGLKALPAYDLVDGFWDKVNLIKVSNGFDFTDENKNKIISELSAFKYYVMREDWSNKIKDEDDNVNNRFGGAVIHDESLVEMIEADSDEALLETLHKDVLLGVVNNSDEYHTYSFFWDDETGIIKITFTELYRAIQNSRHPNKDIYNRLIGRKDTARRGKYYREQSWASGYRTKKGRGISAKLDCVDTTQMESSGGEPISKK